MQTLKDIRQKHQLTQKEAARLLGVSYSYYVKVEEKRVNAGRGFIAKFARCFPNENLEVFFLW